MRKYKLPINIPTRTTIKIAAIIIILVDFNVSLIASLVTSPTIGAAVLATSPVVSIALSIPVDIASTLGTVSPVPPAAAVVLATEGAGVGTLVVNTALAISIFV